MRGHAFVSGSHIDFSDVDDRFGELLDSAAAWLDADGTRRARLGLHELLVNIRMHAYDGGDGPIDIGMTVTPGGFTVTTTDWGRAFDPPEAEVTPVLVPPKFTSQMKSSRLLLV